MIGRVAAPGFRQYEAADYEYIRLAWQGPRSER